MSKEKITEEKKNRKAQVLQNETLAGLKKLRKDGVLTREEFRLICFSKGLPNGLKGSPMITQYVPDPNHKGKGTPPVVAVKKALVRI